MWMSKIKKYLQELDRTSVLNIMLIISITSIIFIYAFALINGLKEIIGYDNIEKIVDIVSSLATAFTLAFLVYQHKKDDSKNYQMIMVEEAKLVVEKMIEQLEEIRNLKSDDIKSIGSYMIELSNHAIDFDDFQNSVKDPGLKKILCVRWQDMYFNHYDEAFVYLDIFSIINSNSIGGASEINSLIYQVKEEVDKTLKGGEYQEYEFFLSLVRNAKEKGLYDIAADLMSQESFKNHFLDNEKIGKYMEGVSSYSNPKERYPSLCAIVDASISK